MAIFRCFIHIPLVVLRFNGSKTFHNYERISFYKCDVRDIGYLKTKQLRPTRKKETVDTLVPARDCVPCTQ
jgi:hypothetical protein